MVSRRCGVSSTSLFLCSRRFIFVVLSCCLFLCVVKVASSCTILMNTPFVFASDKFVILFIRCFLFVCLFLFKVSL